MFTSEQKAHFDTFGFVVLRCCYSAVEMAQLGSMFDTVMAERVQSSERVEIWPCVVDFALGNGALSRTFVERNCMFDTITALLGGDFLWYGLSYNLFGGNSRWHPDQHGDERGSVKALLYLDPLRRWNGCLRVIPGSHRSHLHEMLKPHQPPGDDPDSAMFGLTGSEVPAHALESDPGDMIIFSKCLWHAAFGAADKRRMVSFSFAPHRATPDQIQYLRHFFQQEADVLPPRPAPAELLRRAGRERMAGIIGRLTGLGLHSPGR